MAILSFGFLVLILFFTSIEFLPTFDIQSVISIITTVTIFSICCIIVLALMNVLPSLSWYELFISNSKNLYFFQKEDDQLDFFQILYYFGFPIILSISSLAILISNNDYYLWYLLIPFSIYILILLNFSYKIKKNYSEVIIKNELMKIITANIVSSFCIILPIYFLLILFSQSNEHNSFIGIGIFIAFVAVLIFTNIINIVISKKNNNFKRILFSMFFGFILLFYTLVAFQKFDIISKKTLELYKIGNFEIEKIFLKKEGCEIFKAFEIETTPIDDKCIAYNGKILSRIGTETYLEFENKKFPLSSSYIVSWIPKVEAKNEKNN